ncbi:hypothetical protein EDEG_04079 [Edhazardia aedis USNM 41457]|uniref:Uncharacterized protein n=1 Tax=Edhazardia aedis (strain USNM 41457) TaxID=1003232 RepID=J9DRW1_EDHAE|nr:hypothetical protein EDEG_04079 [Edhazardia aedis USNM 41457]|eukprot:EJW05310.1 hypothetical protein EDEG_04079 [Edhazardia aedis USNM 41457]
MPSSIKLIGLQPNNSNSKFNWVNNEIFKLVMIFIAIIAVICFLIWIFSRKKEKTDPTVDDLLKQIKVIGKPAEIKLRSEFSKKLYEEYLLLINKFNINSEYFVKNKTTYHNFFCQFVSVTSSFWKYFEKEVHKDLVGMTDKTEIDDFKSKISQLCSLNYGLISVELNPTLNVSTSHFVKNYMTLSDVIKDMFKFLIENFGD